MTTKPQLSQQANRLSRLTRDLSRCCQSKEEQIFSRFGLSVAEGRTLSAVAEGEWATPSKLARALGLGRSRLTPVVDSLVRKQLLSRTELPNDRRVRTLALTAAGQKAAREVNAFQTSFHEELLKRFSAEQRGHLLTVLTKLHDAIEDLRSRIGSTG
jgi:DNA-binding MarR family transcriptional regulator